MKASDIIIHRKLMGRAVVKRHQRIMETAAKYWKAVDERLARQQRKKEERMKSKYHFENGETYKYESEAFERFYKEYDAVMRGIPSFLKSDLLRKWVKAHGTRIPKVEIKKGDFVVAFSKYGSFSFSGFAICTVFNADTKCWTTEDGYVFSPNHKRLFICPAGDCRSHTFGKDGNPLVPRTIEDAEMFCQEVTE